MENKPKNSSLPVPPQDFDEFDRFLDALETSDKGAGASRPAHALPAREEIFLGSYGQVISFLHPQGQQPLSSRDMLNVSSALQDFFDEEMVPEDTMQHFRAIVAFPGDLLASEIPQNTTDEQQVDSAARILLMPGAHVKRTANGKYIAEQYGFVCLEGNKLSLKSPLRINRAMTQVDWLIPDDHPPGVKRQMLDFWLNCAEVRIDSEQALLEDMEAVNKGIRKAGCYCIASGQAPVPGKDGKIEWLTNIEQSIGLELPDGRIDFKERNLVVNVKAGQALARLEPAKKGIPGRNVHGALLPAADGNHALLIAGNNIKIIQEDTALLYIADVDGALHYIDNRLSVSEILVLPQGVNYQTGNIDFAGDVMIQGLVASGFSVQAGGDVIVTGIVEDGCKIVARGSVVASSINGKNTVVSAGDSLTAQQVHEATLKSGGDIIIGNYAFHAKLRAGGQIQVNKGAGNLGGSIMGGEAWATQKIDVFTAGSKAWVQTELVTGILPDQAERLGKLQDDIEVRNAQIRQLLDYFGLNSFNLDQIRSLIEKSEGITRKGMALRAKYLAGAGKTLQCLLTERKEVMALIGPAPENAAIIIREVAYPNVVVTIGNKKRKLVSETDPVKFRIQDNDLVLSFNNIFT